MAVDIVPELFSKIENAFRNRHDSSDDIKKLYARIRDGTATMHEGSLYARGIGELLSDVLQEYITQDVLPDGKMYYNIANRIVTPMMKGNHKLSNNIAAEIQKIADEKEGVHLSPVLSEFPEERVNDLVNALALDGEEFEMITKRLGEPIANISQSFFDDFIKTNIERRYRAGVGIFIKRTIAGDSCPWCMRLAGIYDYPDDVPADVFKRHDRCKCTVIFKQDKTKEVVHSAPKYEIREGLTDLSEWRKAKKEGRRQRK